MYAALSRAISRRYARVFDSGSSGDFSHANGSANCSCAGPTGCAPEVSVSLDSLLSGLDSSGFAGLPSGALPSGVFCPGAGLGAGTISAHTAALTLAQPAAADIKP